MNETKTPELPTETGQQTKKIKVFKISESKEAIAPKTIAPPPMTDQQIFEAEQQRIAQAYAIVQDNEKRNQELKAQCWQEITDVAAKYGLQIHVSHQPVNVVVDLITLGA